MSKLVELRNKIKENDAFIEKAFSEMPEEGHTGEQKQAIKDRNKENEDLMLEVKEILDMEAIRNGSAARRDQWDTPVDSPTMPSGGNPNQERKTLGEAFLNDPQIKSFFEPFFKGGHVPDKMRIESPSFQAKALLTGASDTSAGALTRIDYKPLVDVPFRILTIRDVITNGTTNSDLVEYPRVVTQTNAAAPVAEATATSGGSGVKPESTLTLEKVTAAVKTIAHWIPATRRALSDAGQIRTLVDQFLRYGLEEELEDQIIGGDGVGENFTGIRNTTGTTAQAWDTNILTTTRKARTKVRVTGRATPNAYLLHPTDWETIDLLQDNENRYYFGGPRAIGNPFLWGLPVVESEGVTQGEGFCADFRQVVVWDREQASITVSDSHSDFFIRNMVAILAEMRAAMGVLRPAAIVEMDLTA